MLMRQWLAVVLALSINRVLDVYSWPKEIACNVWAVLFVFTFFDAMTLLQDYRIEKDRADLFKEQYVELKRIYDVAQRTHHETSLAALELVKDIHSKKVTCRSF